MRSYIPRSVGADASRAFPRRREQPRELARVARSSE